MAHMYVFSFIDTIVWDTYSLPVEKKFKTLKIQRYKSNIYVVL
jgi:hypothetical protein